MAETKAQAAEPEQQTTEVKLKTPAFNPLVRPYTKDGVVWKIQNFKNEAKRGENYHKNNRQDGLLDTEPLELAKDTHMTVECTTGLWEEIRRMLELFVFRLGSLNDSQIRQAMACVHKAKPTNQDINTAKAHVDRIRDQTLDYFTQMMKVLVNVASEGPEVWALASEEERSRIIMEQFSTAPEVMSEAAFPYEYRSVNSDKFFFRDDEQTLKWREMVRIKYRKLACMTYHNRIAKDDPKALKAYWATVMRSQEIIQLNLGNVEDVPTHPTRSKPGKLDKNKFVDANATEVLDDGEGQPIRKRKRPSFQATLRKRLRGL